MLAATAGGATTIVAGPVTWAARMIGQYAAAANAVFATVQLLIALGIAWQLTVKIALGTSIVWPIAAWWLGEGLGRGCSPAPRVGSPGRPAVILYGLLAVLLWLARLAWLALWAASPSSPQRQPARRGCTTRWPRWRQGSPAGSPPWTRPPPSWQAGECRCPAVLAVVLVVIATGFSSRPKPPAAS
jgi:hypothetical protein